MTIPPINLIAVSIARKDMPTVMARIVLAAIVAM
jgi:hypothetical protein